LPTKDTRAASTWPPGLERSGLKAGQGGWVQHRAWLDVVKGFTRGAARQTITAAPADARRRERCAEPASARGERGGLG
jgi:hypothetical protein